jgi:hypothetical protein
MLVAGSGRILPDVGVQDMKRFALIASTAIFALGAPASAALVYSNNFDTDNGGATALNFNGFSGLTVTDGTVDLVHTGDGFGITCAGGAGGCVDLDGSTSDAGVLNSTGIYAFGVGDVVTLAFSISGNQRGGASDTWQGQFDFGSLISLSNYGFSVNGSPVNLGPADTTFYSLSSGSIGAAAPFSNYTMFFTAAEAGTLTFKFFTTGNDNVGPILDNVSLDVAAGAVPEPATWGMMIGGFALAGAAMRRRKAAVSFA